MKLHHCKGYLVTYSVFSGKLQILRFRILTAVNMWKNGFFDHPLAPEGWHRLKLALNNLFITMKWLLTCLDCICSFLLRPCANRRLFIGSLYRHGHGQACPGEKLRTFMKFFHRLKMVQFAKLTCLNRQIPIFWKFSLIQVVLSPDLVIFSQKNSKIENFFQWSKMVQFAKHV